MFISPCSDLPIYEELCNTICTVFEPDYKILFESSPGLYLIVTPEFQIVNASDAYLKATLTNRKDITGRGLFEIFPDNPEDSKATGTKNLRASLERVLQERHPDTMAVQKYDIRRPESEGGGFEERFWSPVNSPVFGENNEVRYIIHRVEDVTEFIHLKKQETEQLQYAEVMKERAQQMEGEVYSRAQEIQEVNDRLRRANESLIKREEELQSLYEKLQRLDQLKAKFFANISHELRTPLALILGPVGKLLSNSNAPREILKELKGVERNAKTLLKHVNNLLDIAKLDAGGMVLQYREIDLALLVRQVASNFQTLAEDRQCRFFIDAPDQILAEVDPEKIQQVLMNLLSNAFKFTPSGGMVRCALHLEESVTESKKQHVILEVSDSGPGIAPQHRDMIFERFYQVEESAIRTFSGTGLGLAIVKEFTLLHQGKVEVHQGEEGGAKFCVFLPLKAPLGIPVTKEEKRAPSTSEEIIEPIVEELKLSEVDPSSQRSGNKPLVLVVEDNPEMGRFIVEILSEEFSVLRALDGRTGLGLAIAENPDVILTDVMMPVMSGDQLVYEVRKIPQLKNIPIILLSAKADDELRLKLLREGAQDYLMKPFSHEELLARVKIFSLLKTTMDEVASKNKELEAFSYSVSHDLKAPLRSIIGNSEALLEDAGALLDDSCKHYLNRIVKSSEKMALLIDSLLDLSRLSRKEMIFESTDLTQLASGIIADLKNIDPKREVSVIIADKMVADGDRQLLSVVLTNLLSNAWKFTTHQRQAQIECGSTKQGDKIVYYVKDNGAGFEMQYASKLFSVFQRLHSTEEFPGIGIGLATVQRIVHRHGGRVWAEAELGKGATFFFTLN